VTDGNAGGPITFRKFKGLSMNDASEVPQSPTQPAILHVCKRELLRPLRDQILRINGFRVDSTLSSTQALSLYAERPYELVLIDVEGQNGITDAEKLCGDIKAANPDQVVAFVCNWRVAIMTDCPDDILRTEFDPAGFVEGVQEILTKHELLT
jgi:DNA-binding response OmpR family regulator